MDIRSLANGAVSPVVNANQPVTIQHSTSFTMGNGARQVPAYGDPISTFAQIQALNNSDLKHMEGLNIQGTLMAVYVRGAIGEVSRPNQQGGDLIVWNSQTWLITKVIESWPLWTKAVMVLQDG